MNKTVLICTQPGFCTSFKKSFHRKEVKQSSLSFKSSCWRRVSAGAQPIGSILWGEEGLSKAVILHLGSVENHAEAKAPSPEILI